MGSIFYVIHQVPSAGAAGGKPAQVTFGRDQQCLRCHLSWDTLGVPGWSVLTTFPRKSEMDYANGGFVDHYKPIEERWGGWYVTGKKLPPRHMGNLPLHHAESDRAAAECERSEQEQDQACRSRANSISTAT